MKNVANTAENLEPSQEEMDRLLRAMSVEGDILNIIHQAGLTERSKDVLAICKTYTRMIVESIIREPLLWQAISTGDLKEVLRAMRMK